MQDCVRPRVVWLEAVHGLGSGLRLAYCGPVEVSGGLERGWLARVWAGRGLEELGLGRELVFLRNNKAGNSFFVEGRFWGGLECFCD